MFGRTIKCLKDYPQMLKHLCIKMLVFALEWGCGNCKMTDLQPRSLKLFTSKEEGH